MRSKPTNGALTWLLTQLTPSKADWWFLGSDARHRPRNRSSVDFMAVPKWSYVFTRAPRREKIDVHGILREWHRAMLLGMSVERLEIDGRAVDEQRLMLLNLWIEGHGAWNATKQNYFAAWERLERVLSGPLTRRVLRRARRRRIA